ncbi:PKD domain-containing protein [Nocardioides sp. SYSU D00065]|uniref:PKD domain-containing protein n=1 Tax=Nocardioides sp. SYSU D00065 TaxID=2817378 RepID=UPI001B31F2A6|nr:PKD domain-containing protein [Nocardioides sp. SYSU D00065]
MRTAFDMSLREVLAPVIQPPRRPGTPPRDVPRRGLARLQAALLALVLGASVVAVAVLGGAVAATGTAAAEHARTWVVDAVDDDRGTRWESVDTGDSTVTIGVGDTVEWQFDRAQQGHDLTSLDDGTDWSPPLREARNAGGEPVRRTFDEPGTYFYYCAMHGTVMTGVVVVTDGGDNQQPTAAPVVTPTSGDAPLVVHATANASDPDGDPVAVSWDFGTGAAATYADHAMFEYTTPGTYVARLRVTDGRGGLHEQEFPITVTGQPAPPTGPEPPTADGALPAVDASAAAGPGLGVSFATQVTTTGTLRPFADAQPRDADLSGTAVLVRRRGQTYTSLVVTGARPLAAHPVHVHERPCAVSDGGAHFRFDTTRPFAEVNEIWPAFTADAAGSSGLVEVTKPQRAGPLAVSVVVHDPDNAARRIGCADLGPGTADLTYAWDFGDGSTATGPDPDHTYARPGTYTATVTVARGSGAHAGHLSVSDTVQVTVGGGAAPVAPPVAPPPADTTGPRISRVAPRRTVRDVTPTVTARLRDGDSGVRARSIVLRVDGRRMSGVTYAAGRGLVRWTPRRRLTPGRHVVRLVARDTAGNRSTETWRFRIRR